jgi:tRNA (pseudouridine54-N1)-methyltransferase
VSRHVVVVGHDAPTTPEFPLSGRASEAGRMDLLARSLVAGLLVSHDIRADADVTLVLGDAVAVRFDGADLQGLNPDERSAAALVRTALEGAEDAVGPLEHEVRPGVFVSMRGFERVVRDAAADGPVVQLHEDGDPAAEVAPPADPTLVLSDHREFTDTEAAVLDEVAGHRVSLGPRAVHADQAVAVANNWLDTDGFRRY